MTSNPSEVNGPSLQTCELGDLHLESGAVVPDFRMTYVTRGTLNAARSNAILSLHGLVADHGQLSSWAGPDGALDTTKYFVIQPDTMGVTTDDPNATTSPSRSGMKMRFPRFNIRDMVTAEHRLLTEGLGITHLAAVTGASMGGIEALQWAVSFPDYMDAVIPVTTQARACRHSSLLWEACRRSIMLDPKWRAGDYEYGDPPRDGTVAGLLIQSLFAGSARGFEQRFTSGEAINSFYTDQSAALAAHTQARDWVYRTWALDAHDIADTHDFRGDLGAAARSINSRLLLIVNSQDQLLPPHESGVLDVARCAPSVKVVDFDSANGHYAHRDRLGMALIATEVRDLLDRIADGRPGFTGPKFPLHWSRADVLPNG